MEGFKERVDFISKLEGGGSSFRDKRDDIWDRDEKMRRRKMEKEEDEVKIKKDQTFEDFISDKKEAFLYFSKLPATRNHIDSNDIENVKRYVEGFNRSVALTYFGTIFGIIMGDRALQKNHLIYGMTYRMGPIRFITMFWAMPIALISLITDTVLHPIYDPKIDRVIERYNLADDFFRSIFEQEKIRLFPGLTPQMRTNPYQDYNRETKF